MQWEAARGSFSSPGRMSWKACYLRVNKGYKKGSGFYKLQDRVSPVQALVGRGWGVERVVWGGGRLTLLLPCLLGLDRVGRLEPT